MGAFLGGLILGYSPYMLGILNNGRLAKTNHAWIQLVALAAWSLAHQRREGGATRWAALGGWPLLGWVAALPCLISSPSYFVATGLLCTAIALRGVVLGDGWWARARAGLGLGLMAGGTALLGVPFLPLPAHARDGAAVSRTARRSQAAARAVRQPAFPATTRGDVLRRRGPDSRRAPRGLPGPGGAGAGRGGSGVGGQATGVANGDGVLPPSGSSSHTCREKGRCKAGHVKSTASARLVAPVPDPGLGSDLTSERRQTRNSETARTRSRSSAAVLCVLAGRRLPSRGGGALFRGSGSGLARRMANYPTGPASTKSSFQGRFTADRRGPGTLLTLLAGCGIWGEPPPTSLLLISVDTLRPDHLGCYDYHRDTSPNIDAFAADGVLFEQAVSSTSWTLPAHAAMFTGLSDSVHGCTDTDRSLAQAHRTLAERLAEAGYQTAGFYSGPYLHAVFGLDQGFERWVDCTSYPELNDQKAEHEGTVDGREVWKASHADVTNPTVLREVRGWMEEDPQEPFFAFVHLWDTHYDFLPPSPWDTMFDPDYDGEVTGEGFMFDPRIRPGMPQRDLEHLLALYDGEIAWTDHHVGGILELLEERGLDDHTLVVLLSDHGTAFFEHGQKIHRNALYDELIRIPLIMRLPGSLPTGLRVQDQARTIDLVPTVLELLGFPSAEDVMGQSLTPAWRPDTDLFQEPAISELHSVGHALRSYRHPERKIIVDEERRRLLLYDLTADPGEQSPMRQKQSTDGLGARLVEDWKQGERSLEESRTRLAPPTTTAEPTLDDDVRGQLRELGYID